MSRQTDGEARIRRLYGEYGSMLLAYATRWNHGDRQRGEDAVQETFVRAWRHPLPEDASRQAERSWLLTVTRNVCIDGHRSRQSRPHELGGAALEALDHEPGGNDIERALERWSIADALDDLSPDHRRVLEETFFLGHSVAEAAEILGIPEGTVKSRAFHALRALRRALVSSGVSP